MTKHTDTTKPGPFDLLKKDHCRRFVAEAMMLRAQHAYSATWNDALNHYGVDVSADPRPASFEALRERYDRLVDEWATEQPDTAGGVLAYLDLVAMIIFGEMASRLEKWEMSPVGADRDFSFAIQLLASARHWLNDRDIEDAVQAERARLGKGDAA